MPYQYLLLLNPAEQSGYAVELAPPSPLREGGPPRPFMQGPPGKGFDIEIETSQKDKADSDLQRSAQAGGHLAYDLLYAEGYIRNEVTVQFRLNAAHLSDSALGNVVGNSGDLLFALAVIMAALPRSGDYRPLAATGVLTKDGRVQSVEGVPAKLRAALAVLPPGGKVFYPLSNAQDIDVELRQSARERQIDLIPVERLDEAVTLHLGIPIEHAWIGPPYRRLESFTEQDRRIFFGREADVALLADKLKEREQQGCPGVLILGASGRGKSSLVQAGLIPHLKQTLVERTLIYDIWRPGFIENFDEAALADALCRRWSHLPELDQLSGVSSNSFMTIEDQSDSPLQQLARELADALPDNACFVWVLNQMEELFTDKIPESLLSSFCAFLHALQKQGVWVIGTLRSEFYHTYEKQKPLLDMFNDGGLYTLRELNATALERVIRGPAEELKGLRFETDTKTGHNLALQLRDDALAGGIDVLPLLEVTLDYLYEKRDVDQGVLTFEAYRNVGGLLGAIGTHADGVIAGCSKEEKALLPEVLGRLIRLSDNGEFAQRQRARRQNFRSDPVIYSLLDKLVDGRLLISERNENDEPVVELAHDCLISHWPEVGKAISIHRELLEEKRKLMNAANHWEQAGKPKRLLISKAREVLDAEVLVACIDNDIDLGTKTFLAESIRLTRVGFRMLWILLIGALFAAGFSFLSEKKLITFGFTTISAFAPLFLLFRSFKPKSYLSTARRDLIYSYVYLCPLLLTVFEVVREPSLTFASFGLLITDLWILIPPCLVIRSIFIKRKALKIIRLKHIETMPRIHWYSRLSGLFSRSVFVWWKVEVAIWVFIAMVIYVSAGSNLDRGYKASAGELTFAHHFEAEQMLEQGKLDNALQHLKSARELLQRFMGARSSTYAEGKMQWHEENIATETTPKLLNSCRLLIKANEPLESIKDCQLAAEISRYWINKKTEKYAEWQNNLAVALTKEGLAQVELKNHDRAMAAQVEAKQQLEQLVQSFPDTILYQLNLGLILKRIGDIQYKSGAKDVAQHHYRDARKLLETVLNAKNSGFDITHELLELYTSIAAVAQESSDNQARQAALRAAQTLLEYAKEKALQALWLNQPLEQIKQQLMAD